MGETSAAEKLLTVEDLCGYLGVSKDTSMTRFVSVG